MGLGHSTTIVITTSLTHHPYFSRPGHPQCLRHASLFSSGEVVARLAKASRAFGCLRSAIFRSQRISVATKREVYRAVILSTLLYGAETWAVKADSVRKMRGFHNRCIRSMLGVSRFQQWKERITSKELAKTLGMTESMTEILRRQAQVAGARSQDG